MASQCQSVFARASSGCIGHEIGQGGHEAELFLLFRLLLVLLWIRLSDRLLGLNRLLRVDYRKSIVGGSIRARSYLLG